MKWWPEEPKPGDMIRIRLGQIYHYGVFISETEIIQFGPPPLAVNRDDTEPAVCVTDIDAFSCGKIIETALPDSREKRRRLAPDKTIEAARARIGETGYDLLHNNCEHFAYECVFGYRYSEQENEARIRWNSRPILDVYIVHDRKFPHSCDDILSPERKKEILLMTDAEQSKKRILSWCLLQFALRRSLSADVSGQTFGKRINGKWHCKDAYFSLAYCGETVYVAVSNAPVGIAAEDEKGFEKRLTDDGGIRRFANRICSPRELKECVGDTDALLKLWVLKRSIYKASGHMLFRPKRIDPTADDMRIFSDGDKHVAVSGKQQDALRVWYYEDGEWRLMML